MIVKWCVVSLSILLLSSCSPGPAENLAKVASKQTPRVVRPIEREIVYPKRIPLVKLPKSAAVPTEGDVEGAAVGILEPHVGDAGSDGEARRWVQMACHAKDLYEAGTAKNWSSATRKSVESFGGSSALQLRIESLAKDLHEAESGRDVVVQLGAFTICEAV